MCYPDRMAILYIPWHKGELCVWSIMVGFQCHSTLLKVYIFGIVASQQISNKQNIFYFFFQEDQDWGIVAMVLDRLFLWMFAITAISGSLLILSESPYIYDTTSPIDVVFSKIAQQEARIFDEDKLLVWDLAQPRQVWTHILCAYARLNLDIHITVHFYFYSALLLPETVYKKGQF